MQAKITFADVHTCELRVSEADAIPCPREIPVIFKNYRVCVCVCVGGGGGRMGDEKTKVMK